MCPEGPVVVGVDGSQQSVSAASWAAEESALRHADVHLVLANDAPARDEELRAMLQGVVDRLASRHPRLNMRPEIVHGHPATELINRSTRAQLVVVGSRGHGPIVDMLLGSVSTKLAHHAHCPIVVVREHHRQGPVLVGVDGSAQNRTALRFAFQAAAERAADLIAMQVWDVTPGVVPIPDEHLRQCQETVHRGITEQLAGYRKEYPTVSTRAVAARGHPVVELTKAAGDAQLLVVGGRGGGGFAELLLGSVATGVLHHAPGTVAVVHNDRPATY